jgi:hypothetical protein
MIVLPVSLSTKSIVNTGMPNLNVYIEQNSAELSFAT